MERASVEGGEHGACGADHVCAGDCGAEAEQRVALCGGRQAALDDGRLDSAA
jgi:hypothetical protein